MPGSSYIRKTQPPADGFWWLTTSFATFGVTVQHGKVLNENSAPISHKFAGQPFENLTKWLGKDPAFAAACLREAGTAVLEDRSAANVS
jgi:hypothetical protein